MLSTKHGTGRRVIVRLGVVGVVVAVLAAGCSQSEEGTSDGSEPVTSISQTSLSSSVPSSLSPVVPSSSSAETTSSTTTQVPAEETTIATTSLAPTSTTTSQVPVEETTIATTSLPTTATTTSQVLVEETTIATTSLPPAEENVPYEQIIAQASQALVVSEIITGMIYLSSSGFPTSVSLNPTHSRTTGSWVNPTGDYLLELLDSSDVVLRSIPFNARKREITCDPGPCPASAEPDKASLRLVINDPPDYSKLRFSKSSSVFATITRSASTPWMVGPVLHIPESAAQVASAQAASEDIVISWTAGDNDNDSLKYTVFYSTDSGKTYFVLIINTDATSFRISPDLLGGSNTARIAVSATDGLRTTFSESTTFSVANKYPVATITSLGTDDTLGIISGRQSFVLSARGYDLEDGNLPSEAFSWHSSIDGNLGTGRYIVVSSADLTAGEHVITMTATDSAGQQVSDKASITITH